MTKKLIAIDDGHGEETLGKRTPKFSDGTFMKENHFNKRVAELMNIHLIRSGFKTLMVAPSDDDTPLSVRVNLANSAKADFYISIHANAIGDGMTFNSGRGIETFHYPESKKSEQAAKIIHKYLLQGTKLLDRGVKTANFYVLKNTNMPAVLAECCFMTNLEEANFLKSEAYRQECAIELAKGICEYFGAPYVPVPEIKVKVPELDNKQVPVPVEIDLINSDNETETVEGFIVNGKSYVELRRVGDFFGAQVGWDGKKASLKK